MSDQEPASGIPPDAWPVPLDLPLYVSVERAAGCAAMFALMLLAGLLEGSTWPN